MSEDESLDDDWFERALEADAAEEGANADAEDRSSADAAAGDRTAAAGDDDAGGDDAAGRDSDAGAPAETRPDAGAGVEPTRADDAFGDAGAGGTDPFGAGGRDGTGDGTALFDEDFDEAMGAVGAGGDFDDADLESDIPRLDVGIEGLDSMIQGGLPRRHLAVVIGGAGTGKTTFGLQFLQHGLTRSDTQRGVFITLEQTREDIVATADEHGWEFERHERAGDLAVVDLDPVEMANSLDNIRGELPALIEEFEADRFVLDSVSLLEMMYDEQARRRTEVFDFTQSLKDAGVTTVLTSEADEDNPYASRHGIIEYLTDAVFLLRYVRSETQETRLAVEIQKIRNANHSRETKPYEITLDGISVYEQANIF